MVSLQGSKVLAKYVALYAAQLLTSGAALSALKLFLKFGTSANPQVGVSRRAKLKVCLDKGYLTLVRMLLHIRASTSTASCVWMFCPCHWGKEGTRLMQTLGICC